MSVEPKYKVVWLFDSDGEQDLGERADFATFAEAHAWAYGADGPDCYWLSVEPIKTIREPDL